MKVKDKHEEFSDDILVVFYLPYTCYVEIILYNMSLSDVLIKVKKNRWKQNESVVNCVYKFKTLTLRPRPHRFFAMELPDGI